MDLRKIETHQERGVNMAAALTRLQMTYAEDLMKGLSPARAAEPGLFGALVQAMATNYAAVVTGKVG